MATSAGARGRSFETPRKRAAPQDDGGYLRDDENVRPDPHLYRARRSRASGAVAVGERRKLCTVAQLARARRRGAALRRFRARTGALQPPGAPPRKISDPRASSLKEF